MNRTRNQLSHTMHVSGSPEQVFPLLCPVREYEWIENWQCELIYSKSGKAEADCVFRTRFPQDGPEDTWVVSRYEPPRMIEFIRCNALRVVRYSITLDRVEAGLSTWIWSQTLTGLNDTGDALVASGNAASFAEKIAGIERRLNHFLTTGTMLNTVSA